MALLELAATITATNCFEGERPDTMAQDNNGLTFAFGVEWASNERRVITNGNILPVPT